MPPLRKLSDEDDDFRLRADISKCALNPVDGRFDGARDAEIADLPDAIASVLGDPLHVDCRFHIGDARRRTCQTATNDRDAELSELGFNHREDEHRIRTLPF